MNIKLCIRPRAKVDACPYHVWARGYNYALPVGAGSAGVTLYSSNNLHNCVIVSQVVRNKAGVHRKLRGRERQVLHKEGLLLEVIRVVPRLRPDPEIFYVSDELRNRPHRTFLFYRFYSYK